MRAPPTSGPFGRDFEAYYAAGAVWDAGGDPYGRAVWAVERTVPGVDAARDELLPYVGPPAALPFFGALARLPYALAVLLWSVILAAALGALVLALLALAREQRRFAYVAAFAFAFGSGPTTSDLGLGQAALVAVAGIALALIMLERGRIGAAAAAMLLAAAQPNLTVALIARLRDRAACLAATVAAVAFAALALAAGGGFAGCAAYLRRLGEHGAAERFVTIQHSPAAIAWSLGAAPSLAVAVGAACALAALAAVAIAIVRARLDPRSATLLALPALPFAVPFFHEHDFVIALVPLTLLALGSHGVPRALAGAAAVLILVDWFGLAQRGAAVPQLAAQGVGIACAFASLGAGSRLRRTDLVPFTVLTLLACAAIPLARAHPAPTWPDALPPAYRAPATADASAVWHDEQRAAGLIVRDPVWAALRALPLTGCVVLGVAIVLGADPLRCRRLRGGRTPSPGSAENP
ncbi:MAG: DUF2029 domain-containing protein [Candidatus Eremiobacteraeota bacterium]|nr:DUF2029 domain-containing protein [Candidatus Eremiobacteraeota bacterium]